MKDEQTNQEKEKKRQDDSKRCRIEHENLHLGVQKPSEEIKPTDGKKDVDGNKNEEPFLSKNSEFGDNVLNKQKVEANDEIKEIIENYVYETKNNEKINKQEKNKDIEKTDNNGAKIINSMQNIIIEQNKDLPTFNKIETMKFLVKEIKNYLLIPRKNEKSKNCVCYNEIPLENLTDIFKNYGMLVYCIKNHIFILEFNPTLFLKCFLLELLILSYFDEKPVTICDILSEHKKKDFYEREKYICAYKIFFKEKEIHVNCEQEVDSLTYKYFKLFIRNNESKSQNFFDLLLFLLLKRKESERFFNVFKNYNKTSFSYRFALLISLQNQCCLEINEVMKMVNDENMKQEGIIFKIHEKTKKKAENFNLKKSTCNSVCDLNEVNKKLETFSVKSSIANYPFDLLNKILDDESIFKNFENLFIPENNLYDLNDLECINYDINSNCKILFVRVIDFIYDILEFNKEINVWFEEKKIKQVWENNVQEYARGRNKDSSVEHSMIKTCIHYKKYEEGYMIYKFLRQKDDACLLKTSILCLCALKNTGNNIWIERICDLLRDCAVRKNKEACCTFANCLFDQVKCMHSQERDVLLINVICILEKYHYEENEEMTSILLKGFFSLCFDCKDAKTCEMCYKYTLKIYKKWRNTQEGFFFFKRKSRLSDRIYSYVLAMCDENNDKNAFNSVCRDILDSTNESSENILLRLENYHKKCNCDKFRNTNGADKKYFRGFLKHCMELY
ncbi:hypothetical protein GVAV_002046 [Gurleya vavrai]